MLGFLACGQLLSVVVSSVDGVSMEVERVLSLVLRCFGFIEFGLIVLLPLSEFRKLACAIELEQLIFPLPV